MQVTRKIYISRVTFWGGPIAKRIICSCRFDWRQGYWLTWEWECKRSTIGFAWLRGLPFRAGGGGITKTPREFTPMNLRSQLRMEFLWLTILHVDLNTRDVSICDSSKWIHGSVGLVEPATRRLVVCLFIKLEPCSSIVIPRGTGIFARTWMVDSYGM